MESKKFQSATVQFSMTNGTACVRDHIQFIMELRCAQFMLQMDVKHCVQFMSQMDVQ